MSNKEMCIKLLEEVPEYKAGYILAYIQGIVADENADDAFCDALYTEYLTDPDKGETMTEEELCRELGIAL